MYVNDKEYKSKLPPTTLLLYICDKAFMDDDELFIDELAYLCRKELNIAKNIAHYHSRNLRRSNYKTILTEKIRRALNNYRLKCGVLMLKDTMYYKTLLFDNFIEEIGFGETSHKKIKQFKKDHPEYVHYLSERHFTSLMNARDKQEIKGDI